MIDNQTNQSIVYALSKKILNTQVTSQWSSKGNVGINSLLGINFTTNYGGEQKNSIKFSVNDIETIITLQPNSKSNLGLKNLHFDGSYYLTIWIRTQNLIKQYLVTNLKLGNKKDAHFQVCPEKKVCNVYLMSAQEIKSLKTTLGPKLYSGRVKDSYYKQLQDV